MCLKKNIHTGKIRLDLKEQFGEQYVLHSCSFTLNVVVGQEMLSDPKLTWGHCSTGATLANKKLATVICKRHAKIITHTLHHTYSLTSEYSC